MACVALAACGGDDLSRSFGLTRDAPDEFTVTTRAPLSLPPDYSLRPPQPGASRPQELSSRDAAEAALVPQAALGNGGASATTASAGEQALLGAAGPAAPSDIRQKVDAQSALDQPSSSLTDKLMFWRSPPTPGTAVDAQREAERLRENAALGADMRQGDTPIIQRKSTSGGLLDGITNIF